MNTKQVDYCIGLAHTLNFSRAADNLFVSQPTFSYQIKLLEEEVGFAIFERSGRGASLTPAGEQFVSYLQNMREELKRAIEQGQNFSSKYKDDISISMMVRQAIYFLPEAMKLFASKIYIITDKNDPLADQNLITESDLYGRTLMVGGGSPTALRSVQQRLISSKKIDYFNSPDHDTTLTNVAAGRGICLAPGFLNDHSNQFAWIPFDCKENFSCVLCTHKTDNRKSLYDFVEILRKLYKEAVAFPL